MTTTSKRLSGRRIIVTGAASGIGAATSRLFARQGAKVMLFDHAVERLAPIAEETGGTPFIVDVRDSAAVNIAVAKVAEENDGLDGLVNAAGIIVSGTLAETTDDIWQRVLEVNLFGTFYLCRAAMPYLQKADNSTIVNISSGAALVPSSGSPSYAASKGGVIAFTKAIAMTCGPEVRVNAIAPGLVDTPLIRDRNEGQIPAGSHERYALKRIAKPEEIADAILFLTGPESAFVTGITLPVDGGRTYH
ncbi:SDR family oxidoreductase [Corticibacterium sp. UT-5YL-CI-8]|nr:SDR family oxidoreductase [Tianweitania sp. UT-5YL-CI-8]